MAETGNDKQLMLVRALRNISTRFASEGIHNTSPLGVWMLAAYQAAASNTMTDAMRAVLGMELIPALDVARELVQESPEAVNIALAGWSDSKKATTLFERTDGFASNHREKPSYASLSDWIRESTLGLITDVPFSLEGVEDVFASAIATDVKWRDAFDVIPVNKHNALTDATKVLADNDALIEAFDWNGYSYAVMTKADVSGELDVHSIAALQDGEGAQAGLIDAARAWAMGAEVECTGLTMEEASKMGPFLRDVGSSFKKDDSYSATIPAWSVSETSSLDKAFPELASIAGELGREDAHSLQSVVADYDTQGFKAAAVTATFTVTAARPTLSGGRRYELNFNRPFAVIAATELNGVSVPLFEFLIDETATKEPFEN